MEMNIREVIELVFCVKDNIPAAIYNYSTKPQNCIVIIVCVRLRETDQAYCMFWLCF